ncbi:MAG: T9SS type A sorting domain-containing protein [Bacteroidetes bacterium]|nr:T9SS type A sorting domain-containing protein [Bacteroidota bacterium]
MNKTSDFSIYPNPNSGTFTIQTQNSSEYQLKIFDLLGKEIPFTLTQVNQNTKTIQIPAGKGIYFVKIKSGNDVFVQRVLVF